MLFRSGKSPAYEIQIFNTLPNSSSSLGWPAVSRLMEGYSCHFSLHYIYRSGSPPEKKSYPLSLTSTTRHRNFPSPSLSPPPPPSRIIAAAFIRRPSRCTSKPHPPAPALSSTTPDNHNLQTLHSSTTPPEPLELRCRPPHRSRFADAFVVCTGCSSPTAVFTGPQPLHRRRRA